MNPVEAAKAHVMRLEARDLIALIDESRRGREWLQSLTRAWEALPSAQRRIRQRNAGWTALTPQVQELTAAVYTIGMAANDDECSELFKSIAKVSTRALIGERTRRMAYEEGREYIQVVAHAWAGTRGGQPQDLAVKLGQGFEAAQAICGSLGGLHRALTQWISAGAASCPPAKARACALNMVFSMRDLIDTLHSNAQQLEAAAVSADRLPGGPHGGKGWSAPSRTRLSLRLADRWSVFFWPFMTPDPKVPLFGLRRCALALGPESGKRTIEAAVRRMVADPRKMFERLKAQDGMLDLDAEHMRAGVEGEAAQVTASRQGSKNDRLSPGVIASAVPNVGRSVSRRPAEEEEPSIESDTKVALDRLRAVQDRVRALFRSHAWVKDAVRAAFDGFMALSRRHVDETAQHREQELELARALLAKGRLVDAASKSGSGLLILIHGKCGRRLVDRLRRYRSGEWPRELEREGAAAAFAATGPLEHSDSGASTKRGGKSKDVVDHIWRIWVRKPANWAEPPNPHSLHRHDLAQFSDADFLTIALHRLGALADVGALRPVIAHPAKTGDRFQDAPAHAAWRFRLPINDHEREAPHPPIQPQAFPPEAAEQMLADVEHWIGEELARQASSPQASTTNNVPRGDLVDEEFRPANWFRKGLASRLRMAARKGRKSKRVRICEIDGVVCYSVSDACRWWGDAVLTEDELKRRNEAQRGAKAI